MATSSSAALAAQQRFSRGTVALLPNVLLFLISWLVRWYVPLPRLLQSRWFPRYSSDHSRLVLMSRFPPHVRHPRLGGSMRFLFTRWNLVRLAFVLFWLFAFLRRFGFVFVEVASSKIDVACRQR